MTTRQILLRNPGFGRRRPFVLAAPARPAGAFADDFKLFATTWLAGFVFVSILLA